ncbi:MAG: phosphoribosylformylglycinamidine synthase subunit PurL [candidate division Zixibacteria bacterium]|nr:phosphoribosylformylglycinamidine synthase subunit PurL [candidate division Zixibacteria bacterium]
MADASVDKRKLKEVAVLAARWGLRIAPQELVRVWELLGRAPTKVEAYLFDVAWSEHCSYKSSRRILRRYLPTRAPNVVFGPGQDAGVVRLFTEGETSYCVAIAHESHNHPSQVLPLEGAATGIGGIVRDVYCMGADVVAVLDPLRFGATAGENEKRTQAIARGVVEGIWRYANAIGVPNAGGDAYFDECYDDNCLVNVVAVGVVNEGDVVESRAPAAARYQHYVLVLVGKPTDDSGVGGASFASAVLDEEEGAENRAAVQVPDPFLKRVLAVATREVLARARAKGVELGIKDLGAGGLGGAASELCAAAKLGGTVDLDKVPVALEGLEPAVVAVGETQERYVVAAPSYFADEILAVYNDEFELPRVFPGAQATVIGEIMEEKYFRMTARGEVVAEVPLEVISTAPSYRREAQAPAAPLEFVRLKPPADLAETLIELLASPNICSRGPLYEHYDRNVQGNTVIEAGEADAAVLAPWPGKSKAIALACDGNPYIGALDPYAGGAHAVLEACRNVVAVGATPVAVTDCLNFGSPEDPAVFWTFEEAVRGIGDACRGLGLRGTDAPLPVVSGNVSFYNQSTRGVAVKPSPVVCAVGFMEDFALAVTMQFKEAGNPVYLLGRRWGELGASQYYQLRGRLGWPAPMPRFGEERQMHEAVLELVETKCVAAAHDVADGGLAVCLAEMIIGAKGSAALGCDVDVGAVLGSVSPDAALFCENGGFVVEVRRGSAEAAELIMDDAGVDWWRLGEVVEEPRLVVKQGKETLLNVAAAEMAAAWSETLKGYF